jgi:gliding motility-associated-like protein
VVTGINEGVAIVSYTSGFCGAAVAHITVAGPPKPVAGSNGPLCEGQTLMLKAWHSTPGGTYTWAYPFGGGSSDQNPVIPNVTVAASGIYTVTYTIGGCTAFALLNETVYPYVVLTNVTPGQTIAYGGEVQLFATGATYYNWAPPLTLSNPNINNPLATPLETTVYTVYGMNDAGCPDTATVTITIDDDGDEFIPTAFSPNGDGLNDVFRIRGMRNKKLVDFSIYNRWGERVYQNTYAPGEGWDGTYKGTPQDLGVYNYCIIVGRRDGTLRIYKGDVTLVR